MKQKTNLLIPLIILLFSAPSYGQFQEWHGILRSASGQPAANDMIYDMEVDKDSNLLITGTFSYTVDFDMTSGTYLITNNGACDFLDAFVLKMDRCKNLIWAKNMGGNIADFGNKVATDPFGNVFCTGNFRGTSDFLAGTGSYLLSSNGSKDASIFKLNSLGDLQWAYQIGGTMDDDGTAVVAARDAVYFGGVLKDTVDLDPTAGVNETVSQGGFDAYLVKIDSSGNHLWSGAIQSNGNIYIDDIVLDSSENIYVAGNYSGTADFDITANINNSTATGSSDAFICKYDSTGNLIWHKSFIGPGYEFISGIKLRHERIYFTGNFSSNIDLDPNAGSVIINNSVGGCFKAEIDLNGNLIDGFGFGGSTGFSIYDMDVGNDSSVFVTGQFTNGGDIDPGPGSVVLSTFNGAHLTVKFDSLNNYVWHKMMDPIQWSNGVGTSIKVVNDDIFVGGHFSGVVDIDTGPGYAPIASADTVFEDGLLFKYSNSIYTGVSLLDSISDTITYCDYISSAPFGFTPCHDSIAGIPDVSMPITSPGTHVINWGFNDGFGNITSFIQEVIILPINPTIAYQGDTLFTDPVGLNYQWIDCSTGTEVIGATNNYFVPQAIPSSYSVIVQHGSCIDTSSCFSVTGNTLEPVLNKFSVYPNPSSGNFTIDLGELQKFTSVAIFDISGRVIAESKVYNKRFLEQHLNAPPGLYNIKIDIESKTANIQLIIE